MFFLSYVIRVLLLTNGMHFGIMVEIVLKANISLYSEYFYRRLIETRLPLYLFDLHVTTILL